jgi:hypothetical protein
MNGHIVTPFRRRPELFRSPQPAGALSLTSANHQHASSGWGEAPLGDNPQLKVGGRLLPPVVPGPFLGPDRAVQTTTMRLILGLDYPSAETPK